MYSDAITSCTVQASLAIVDESEQITNPSSGIGKNSGEPSGEQKVDKQMKELVAMGAAAAANCHPCMDYHLAKCEELGIDLEEVAAAVKVGLMVNRGAENAIRKKARGLLGETAVEN